MAELPGGLITEVVRGGQGHKAGLEPGDRLLKINGHLLRDIIDVQFYGADEVLELRIERSGRQRRVRVQREYGSDLGLVFANPTFDVEIRRCANNCEFCFVKQNAPGLRRSLFVKDDDYRYSFLFGNFVTLTNLTEDDWHRLAEQRLSPLFVSVHATDVDLRKRLLAFRSAPDITDQLRRLAGLGIEVHAQVVLVPGLNDGDALPRTVEDLTGLYHKPVVSVGIVPIGLTQYHRGQCRPYSPQESRDVLDQVESWRTASLRTRGTAFLYPSDEWYLVAGRPVPPAAEYDGFPQLDNGVGLVRQFLDQWQRVRADLPGRRIRVATLVTGMLFAPILSAIVQDLNNLTGASLQVLAVTNRLFGSVTTVAGLLSGRDIVGALQGIDLGDLVLLPRAVFTSRYGAGSAAPGVTLDDLSMPEIARQLGVEVQAAGTLDEALALLRA